MINIIRRLSVFIKFYGFSFKHEGVNCSYRSFNSKFFGANCITLGSNVYLGSGTELHGEGGIEIGNGVIFAPDVVIYTRTHNFDSPDLKALPFDDRMLLSPVIISDYVWIGRGVTILPGVTIGVAAVVGAGSVVSRDIPDYAVAVGNPCQVIKYRNAEKVEALLREEDPFVYSKLGHRKEFVQKHRKNA